MQTKPMFQKALQQPSKPGAQKRGADFSTMPVAPKQGTDIGIMPVAPMTAQLQQPSPGMIPYNNPMSQPAPLNSVARFPAKPGWRR
jgi:hypothetical protein